MPYSIYGDKIDYGYCEVHPWVNQTYPCSICYDENQKDLERKNLELVYQNKMEKEDHDKMEQEYYEEIARKNSLLYRILCYIEIIINTLNNKIKKQKEKILPRIVVKHTTK